MLKNTKPFLFAFVAFLSLTTSAFANLPTNTYTLTSGALPQLTLSWPIKQVANMEKAWKLV